MLLGNYYDEVVKEANGLTSDIEQTKIAEAANLLDEAGYEFETEKDAMNAINEVIENDYTEKVASVCAEFDKDEISFNSEEEKVASAMEIVDGWEKTAVPAGLKKIIEKIKGAGSWIGRKSKAGGQKIWGGTKATGRHLNRNKLHYALGAGIPVAGAGGYLLSRRGKRE